MTAPHPLATDDAHLIQDYLVTKLTFFLAAGADDGEWQHELDEQQSISGEQWERQNAFLLDYTVARFLAASDRPDADDTLLRPAGRTDGSCVSSCGRWTSRTTSTPKRSGTR